MVYLKRRNTCNLASFSRFLKHCGSTLTLPFLLQRGFLQFSLEDILPWIEFSSFTAIEQHQVAREKNKRIISCVL